MNDATMITMRKDVLELILQNERTLALQEKNIRTMENIIKKYWPKPEMKVYKDGKLIMMKGGNSHE
ncbi:MAG: hypothetical protein ACK5LF_18640 [Bacteroides xylanisolvens]|jgi:hypothetical protein|uniref:hypothetical protein n=1 Tax=Bacteroides sp. TaxID=29523 RepID=UPI002584D2F4|nr:hypothetical protein [Bacteroides sp.]